MTDPKLSLAISMHSNPGVYGLLVGSGLSSSAGIPTGWEIVHDLIRKLARLRKEQCAPDEENWYTATFGKAPTYTDLLFGVAKSSTERMQLLRSYFEPTDDEREQGLKMPTRAHRAIAELVLKGYLRVIVTTNFDRLLEHALIDAGLPPAVIETSDAIKGAIPLVHASCTIVKVNGDYLDSRLRNSKSELARYDPALNRLLDTILDDYGTLVCGWSGKWDTALRAAINRCPNRRFTTYWARRGPLSAAAESLVRQRRATVLEINSADEFFAELVERVSALESMAITDEISPRVAVARMKKYLGSDSQQINLRDLIAAETERVYERFATDPFAAHGLVTYETILARMKSYESALAVLLPLLICGSYWARPEHDELLISSFRRIADSKGLQGGTLVWLNLQRYPALILLYGMGLAALASGNYRLLRALYYCKARVPRNEPDQPIARHLYTRAVLEYGMQEHLLGYERRHTPLSDYLADSLRDPLREYLPDEVRYHDAFDWLEYLLSLAHADIEYTRQRLREENQRDPQFDIKVPYGRFLWRDRDTAVDILTKTEVRDNGPFFDAIYAALAAGFFDPGPAMQPDKYRYLKEGVDRYIRRLRREMH